MTHPQPALRRGFTLIELVVVLAIVGALLALAAPRYFGALDRGRAQVQAANLHSLREALDKFHADRGRYPDSLDELVSLRYLRTLPFDPVSERSDWRTVPPPAGVAGRVYDVAPPEPLAPAADAEPVGASAGTGPGALTGAPAAPTAGSSGQPPAGAPASAPR